MDNRTEALLTNLVAQLREAVEVTEAIRSEYAENGNDSLANIEYGAHLNAKLANARDIFANLDSAGIFTMGED